MLLLSTLGLRYVHSVHRRQVTLRYVVVVVLCFRHQNTRRCEWSECLSDDSIRDSIRFDLNQSFIPFLFFFRPVCVRACVTIFISYDTTTLEIRLEYTRALLYCMSRMVSVGELSLMWFYDFIKHLSLAPRHHQHPHNLTIISSTTTTTNKSNQTYQQR